MIPLQLNDNEHQRQLAFRSLARARQLSLTEAPDVEAAYGVAQRMAQQALNDSTSAMEGEMAAQLMMIVSDDHRRHQRVANTSEFPAAIDM